MSEIFRNLNMFGNIFLTSLKIVLNLLKYSARINSKKELFLSFPGML